MEQLIGVTIVKLPSQNFSQVLRFKLLLRDISLRAFFSKRCTFVSARECSRHIFSQYICEWTICAGQSHSQIVNDKKGCCVQSRRVILCQINQTNWKSQSTISGFPQIS